jgi:putative NIF3 family GTP cyclohydrolase 1 type 2
MKTISASLTVFLLLSLSLSNAQNIQPAKGKPAGQVMAGVIKNTGSREIPNTVDVIKEGDAATPVTGIITCMFATMDVLKQAVSKNCNLIIAHEPLYYNHLDETAKFQNDPVYLEKKKYITDHKLVVWRFHDYIHSMEPDGIEMGMIDKLGWKAFLAKGTTNQFVMPETTLKDLLKTLKTTFPGNAFYVIGDPDMKLTNVHLAEGAPGSASHIRLLNDKNIDVLLAGESQQWETYEYMRDAVSQGKKKAIIFLGHINSEEAGMNYCASWLKGFIKDVPVYFVEGGPSFWTY